jgi:hypothetical protein
MRFKKTTEKVVMSGVITVDDLRKKFRIPENATITITVPSGDKFETLNIHEIHVSFEKT